jgi:hypothetical protein
MMKKTLLILLCSCFSFSAFAADDKPSFELMAKAVIYATQADAYNSFCEKKSAMAINFLETFEVTNGVSKKEYNALKTLHESNKSDTDRKLENDGKECKDVEFMITRLSIMRQLKDVSYRLNGVDPATLPPDTMPELEGLLPPRPPMPENKNPLEL